MKKWVSLTVERGEKGYRNIENVMADEVLRDCLLDDALRDMRIFRNKYRNLKELAKVFEAMDDVL